MRLLRDRLFFAVSSTHLMVDILNSQLAVLLAYLSGPLGLSNAQIGLIATAYTICSSLSQPVFGWLADRVGSRWLGAGGLLWMVGFFSAAALLPGRAGVALLVAGAFGSGAFHPAGTMKAAQRGHYHFAGQAATAASVFFLFGQAGLSLGPALGGGILARWGMPGLLLLTGTALPVALNAAVQLRERPGRKAAPGGEQPASVQAGPVGPLERGLRQGTAFLLAFAALLMLRSWAQSNMMTFLPKYLRDLGLDPGRFGVITALFMAGSALGGVAGGAVGDRGGKQATTFWSLLLAVPALYLFPLAGTSAWVYLLVAAAGALTGASHSILVVLAQSLMPGSMALASGLTLGFMFSAGALGSYFSGMLADAAGFPAMFQSTALLCLLGAVLALTLKSEAHPRAAPAPLAGTPAD